MDFTSGKVFQKQLRHKISCTRSFQNIFEFTKGNKLSVKEKTNLDIFTNKDGLFLVIVREEVAIVEV